MSVRLSLILALGFCSGCVSLKTYRAKQEELALFTDATKGLRKEIREQEKEKKMLLDTIKRRSERALALSNAIERRLKENRIKIAINPEDANGISLRSPVLDPADYAERMARLTCRDTHVANKELWLSEKEKKIYYYLNYARLNPRGFCNRFVLPQLRYDSNNIYLLTLIDYMYAMKPMNAVKPDRTQYDAAKCHALSSGKLGYVGHARQDANCRSKFSGECCSYGLSDPLSVVLQLLIDQGVSSLGHRYICLGWYEGCGIAMAPHSGYGTNVVLDFN